jgi:DNA-binding response OmpR family regulator
LSGSKVLVAEDDPSISEIYTVVLKHNGYEVLTARSGRMASDQIRDAKPDVVLLDIMMPDEDGIKVLEEMHANSAGPFPVVIVMTNLDRQDLKKRAKELGADGYVVKSNIVPRDVPEIIEQALQRRASEAHSGAES